MRAKTRADLDKLVCSNPNCTEPHDTPLYLHSACHPLANVAVHYDKKTGELHLDCGECDRPITVISVSPWEVIRGNGQ